MPNGPSMGYIGPAAGMIFGLFFSFWGIARAKGPMEKEFAGKALGFAWIVFGLFLTLAEALPPSQGVLIWIPYAILMAWGIHFWNKRTQVLRSMENSNS